MKIEKISDSDYKIYVFDNYDENDIVNFVKNIIKKMQYRLNIKGFYKVIVTVKKIGLFLKLVKLDESYYKDTLDLKIIFDNNILVYFKTKDFFIINDFNNIRFLDGYYYVLIDNSFDNIIDKIEYGEFIFDNTNFINNGIVV